MQPEHQALVSPPALEPFLLHNRLMRTCEICSGTHIRQLHRQDFLVPGSGEASHYDVVVCENCGFTFADNIPAQLEQSAYYEDSERHLHAADLPAGLAEAHRTFFEFVLATHPHLQKEAAILDVGSSMGHFLNRFKIAGFTNIQGLEPSTAASELARDTYGISVTPLALENYLPGHQFDLITLCGVLEHLVALRETVNRIDSLCAEEGFLFIAVPDAGNFGNQSPREPFLEFALEHINFFTARSLDNLLLPHGFRAVAKTSLWNDFYANHYLLALYEKHPATQKTIVPDSAGRDSLTRYIALSHARLSSIAADIDALRVSAEPIVVWGAGSLASRLCATTSLPECNVISFIDSNLQLHGRTLHGKPIRAPDWLKDKSELTVFVASYVYGDQIKKTLLDMFNWHGRIITLNPDCISQAVR
ncbi:MAG: methyltransferase domain-containing protein [Parasulfuritortus sp.]|nr:methyltransferase domain-containing protein [Parasulfuritortus sp.]